MECSPDNSRKRQYPNQNEGTLKMRRKNLDRNIWLNCIVTTYSLGPEWLKKCRFIFCHSKFTCSLLKVTNEGSIKMFGL